MRTVTTTTNIYKFEELTDEAKDKAKQWLIDGKEPWLFTEFVEEDLKIMFPKSNLKTNYSLGYCQGDGFNIEGEVNLYDALEALSFTKEEKSKVAKIIEKSGVDEYKFYRNTRYGYSCKFLDRKYIEDSVTEIEEEYKYQTDNEEFDRALMKKFFEAFINKFEELDKRYEQEGYDYFYEITDEEASEDCEANGYEFLKDGSKF